VESPGPYACLKITHELLPVFCNASIKLVEYTELFFIFIGRLKSNANVIFLNDILNLCSSLSSTLVSHKKSGSIGTGK
jgi:hypothetical protein